MRAVIQRVSEASVTIEGIEKSRIGIGLLILLGIEEADEKADATWLAAKIAGLRIFPDDAGVMNRSAKEIGASLMIVSQFTLHAMTKKGNRPSYIRAARPETAVPLYQFFIGECQKIGLQTTTGEFGADMRVALVNDGPVTILIDTKNKE